VCDTIAIVILQALSKSTTQNTKAAIVAYTIATSATDGEITGNKVLQKIITPNFITNETIQSF
jgi:hypothetical protein